MCPYFFFIIWGFLCAATYMFGFAINLYDTTYHYVGQERNIICLQGCIIIYVQKIIKSPQNRELKTNFSQFQLRQGQSYCTDNECIDECEYI